jgi:hypothetical protein
MIQSSLTRRENDLPMTFPALKDRAKLIMPLRGKKLSAQASDTCAAGSQKESEPMFFSMTEISEAD